MEHQKEMNEMMETAKRESCLWWFNSSRTRRSQWLQCTLSELDEMTNSMLKIIDQEADSFAQRVEMYYEKRPQLISLVEEFYRTHRSLAIQFDHWKQDPSTRRTSSIARSFSLSTVEPEKVIMSPCRSYDGVCSTKPAYGSDCDSIASEMEEPVPVSALNCDHLTAEIVRLKEDAMVQKRKLDEKDKAMEEMKRKLDETRHEGMDTPEKVIVSPWKSYDGGCFTKPAYDSDSVSVGSEVSDHGSEDANDKAMEEMTRKVDETRHEVMDEPEKAIASPCKSYDGGCFAKPAYDSDSDSIGSEVEDPVPVSAVNCDHLMAEIDRLKEDAIVQKRKLDEKDRAMEEMKRKLDETHPVPVSAVKCDHLMAEIDKLKEDAMVQKRKLHEKDKAMEEMKRKLDETRHEVTKLKEEAEKLKLEYEETYQLNMNIAEIDGFKEEMKRKLDETRHEVMELEKEAEKLKLENVETCHLNMKFAEEKEQLADENESLKEMIQEKDEAKREAIRQLSLAIEMLKSENVVIKNLLARRIQKAV